MKEPHRAKNQRTSEKALLTPIPRLVSRLILYIFLGAIISCKTTYYGRDKYQKSIEDYDTELLSKPNSNQRYYQRAWLYANAAYADRAAFEHCVADVDKAISILTEDKSPFEYFQLRGYCLAAAELEAGSYWNRENSVAGGYRKETISDSAKPKIQKAIADYSTAIGLTPDPLDLVVLYESRAVLHFHLNDHKNSLADFLIVDQFDRKSRRRSTRHREVMHILPIADSERTYTMIRDNYEVLCNQARQAKSAETDRLCAAHEQTKKIAADLYLKRVQSNSITYSALIEQDVERRKSDQEQKKKRLEERMAQSQPCGHCKGTGTVSTFEYGEARHCYGTTHNGMQATACTPTRPSRSGSGTCPICAGTGRVLPDYE